MKNQDENQESNSEGNESEGSYVEEQQQDWSADDVQKRGTEFEERSSVTICRCLNKTIRAKETGCS